jgi:hypothetical protein
MQSITELIDTIHELEDGHVVTIETDDETYHGVVTRTEYTAPMGDVAGHLGVEINSESSANELLAIQTSASASQKFSRPELYAGGFAGDAEGEPLGSVADITVEASDI